MVIGREGHWEDLHEGETLPLRPPPFYVTIGLEETDDGLIPYAYVEEED